MSNGDKENLYQDFVIENNIVKGVEKTYEKRVENVGKKILECFRQRPDHVAQIEAKTGKHTTFAEMEENSIRCALWMQKQGIGNGDVVSICTQYHLDAYIPCIASLLLSVIYNPWNHGVSTNTARHLMKMTRPKVIFVCESALGVIRQASELEKIPLRIIVIGRASGLESLDDIMKIQTEEDVRFFEPIQTPQKDGISMILFSSGTTGLPKGVAHSHETLRRLITGSIYAPKRYTVRLSYSTLDWISGTLTMLYSIVTGATKILHNDFNPDEMCEIIEKYQVEWVFVDSTIANYLSKSKVFLRYECKSLVCLATAGSKFTKEILEELRNSMSHTSLLQVYGMTELGGTITMLSRQSKKIGSLGFVLPNMQFKVIDPLTGEALGPNRPGEICAKSPNMMLGYYNDPMATQAAIDHEGWLHTGDKGYYNSDGELFIVDRLKEIMKYKGHHVSPSEIEELLMTHPAVMEVAVLSLQHDMDGDLPMAFVKKCEKIEVTTEELVDLSSQLEEYKRLRGGVRFVDQMPHTSSGKIDRKTLKEMAKMSR